MKILFSILYILSLTTLYSNDNFRCSKITMEEGLSNNYVEAVLKDNNGFVWIGTWSGLNRYDGKNIKQYPLIAPLKENLKSSWVFTIKQDYLNQIWIGTTLGLFYYNVELDSAIYVQETYGTILDISEDKNGILWIALDDRVIEFDPKEHKVKRILSADNIGLRSIVYDIEIDNNNKVWIGSYKDGLIKFNPKTNDIVKYCSNSELKISSDKIKALSFDNEGKLWVGTEDAGISVLDFNNNTTKHFKHSTNDSNTIGSNFVTYIAIDEQNNIWVSCSNGFLNKYIKESNTFKRYSFNNAKPDNFSIKATQTIHFDEHGNRWIGTHGHGMHYYDKNKNKISIFNLKNKTEDGFIQISSFTQIGKDDFIIGSDGKGLWHYNTNKGIVKEYNETDGLSTDAIMSLGFDSTTNQIWIPMWSGGVDVINTDFKLIHKFTDNSKQNNKIPSNNVKTIFIEDTCVYISTHGFGTCFYSKKLKKTICPDDMLKASWGNMVFSDSKKRVWIATFNGIFKFEDNTTQHIINNPSRMSLSSNSVIAILEDKNKNIWAMSNLGLDKYNEITQGFEPQISQSKFNANFSAFIEDNNGLFWISTDNGIFCYNPTDNHIVKHLTTTNGLLSNQYYQNAVLKSNKGVLFFGGISGFSFFNPSELDKDIQHPRIYITDFLINNIIQRPDSISTYNKHISSSDTLILNYSKNSIGFDFSITNISDQHTVMSAYILENFNNQWTSIKDERKISFTNIPPGSYRLKIKGIASSGLVGTNGEGLLLIIKPAWWQTIWFKILVGLFILFIGYLIYRIRIYQIKKENEHLEELVDAKTSQLAQAIFQLEQHSEELNVSNEMLLENQRIIEKQNAELSEIIKTKDTLMSIIAHDLKNPMNVLHGMSELLYKRLDTLDEEKLKKYSETIYNSSGAISSQLISLLDWARSQSDSMQYNPKKTNVTNIIDDVLLLVKESADSKKISIDFSRKNNSYSAYIDSRMIATVFRNVISNSIKFTPRNGAIFISINFDSNNIIVKISDTGIGLSQDKVDKLFDKLSTESTYGTENEKGTGLGLKICKEFVEKNNGKILVESTINVGTTFSIFLPKAKDI